MKQLIVTILVLFLSFQLGYAQMIDDNTIIKDESGKKIEVSKLMDLMKTGEWALEGVKDADGNLEYVQLRKASNDQKRKMAEMPKETDPTDLIGKKAPKFSVKDINGNMISSQEIEGKVLVLNFWFIACSPCVAEIPELNKVYQKYKDNSNVVFASITFDGQEQVKSFLKKRPINYPVIPDARNISNLFNISSFPTNIVIDKEGNYSDYLIGGSSHIGEEISASIENALKSKKKQ